MPIGVARYKNNMFYKIKKVAVGGVLRKFQPRNGISHTPLLLKTTAKPSPSKFVHDELRIISSSAPENYAGLPYENSKAVFVTVGNPHNKVSNNIAHDMMKITTNGVNTSINLHQTYTDLKVKTSHESLYHPILPSEKRITAESTTCDDITTVSGSLNISVRNQPDVLSFYRNDNIIRDTQHFLKVIPGYVDKFKNLASTVNWKQGQGTIDGFVQNGSAAENTREIGIGPFGIEEMLWVCRNNDTASDADGGWEKDFTVDNRYNYISVVFFKYKTTGSTGKFYHGCLGSSTVFIGTQGDTGMSGTTGEFQNPYFSHINFDKLVPDRWYASVGFINAANIKLTDIIELGGIYDLETKQRVVKASSWRFNTGVTTGRHRVYKYFDTLANTEACFASPIFAIYDDTGNTLKIDDILSCDYYKIHKNLVVDNYSEVIDNIGLYNYAVVNDNMNSSQDDMFIDVLSKSVYTHDYTNNVYTMMTLPYDIPKKIERIRTDYKYAITTSVIHTPYCRNQRLSISKKGLGVDSGKAKTGYIYSINDMNIGVARHSIVKTQKRSMAVNPQTNEKIYKYIFNNKMSSIPNTTRRITQIHRKAATISAYSSEDYEKGELLGVQFVKTDKPIFYENKSEQDHLQITTYRSNAALALSFEFVSPTISVTSDVPTPSDSTGDGLNRLVIESQKRTYTRFNVQLNNTTINNVTGLPEGFNFDGFGIYGSSTISGTFSGNIELVNGNTIPYVLKIYNMKRLQ